MHNKIDRTREALGNMIIGQTTIDDNGQEMLILHIQSYEEPFKDEIIFVLVGVTGSRKCAIPRQVFMMDGYAEEVFRRICE